MTTLTAQHARGAGFLAAAEMYKLRLAPITIGQLHTIADFGKNAQNREIALNRAIATGWLSESPSGMISITRAARDYFGSLEVPEPVYIGQIAGPRTNSAYDRPPLKSITNSRGDHVRAIDDRFQRAPDHHFFSVPVGMP